ncbi:LacI family DNA-binding transcriptional regulator [Anaerocolumna sp. MB42-C2]|uniref:LacI family DNA-binding transcriptional regulator n=1 Tax=Anaerocolumna sp. MB42-C2 TaxID=3070997 RepID=UPI0027DFCB38|nr:substrate-binding domain-containing protein [Anaerocolumna sp. MB42-C2]WMJ86604.1 substrate-binding domain-containing protein [Anaerocolumna sp. MB42-C2]
MDSNIKNNDTQTVNKTVKKNLYEIIIDDINNTIQSGNFSYEKPICTEKQLSLQYGVSRITAKRAITDLEHQGILYRKRGVGSFVVRNFAAKNHTMSNTSRLSNTFAFLLPFDTAKGGLIDTVAELSVSLNKAGYFMGTYITSENVSDEKYTLGQLLEQNIAGIVYYPKNNKMNLDLLNQFVINDKPVVIIDKSNDCSYIHNVTSDNFVGGKLLTEHLVSLGHKNIAFLSNASIDETSSVRDRFGGYIKTLHKYRLPTSMDNLVTGLDILTEQIAITHTSTPKLNSVISKLYNNGVTAILTENDQVANSVIWALRELNISVPEDMSICGFDNTVWSQKTETGITTISQDFTEIGKQVSSILLSSLKDPSYPNQKCIVPVKLIVRGSTLPPRQ